MSESNEPPLALESWSITVDLNDGTDFKLEPEDFGKSHKYLCDEIDKIVLECVEFRIDHLKGKYGQEIEQAEDLHAENSKRFVDYETKSD